MSDPGDSSGAGDPSAGGPSAVEPPQPLVLELIDDEDDADVAAWSALAATGSAAQTSAAVDQRALDQAIAAAARSLARHVALKTPTLVAVALSNDERVAQLNQVYRGKTGPTNVLSFPAPPVPGGFAPPDAPQMLGDVVLARETVLAEALERGIAPLEHVVHLVVHGVLHLVGYDHQTDSEAQAMEALEIAILADLGIANPYREEPEARKAG